MDGGPENLAARLRRIEDRQQIRDILYGYCRGVDRHDVACFRSCFWPDGHYVRGPIDGPAWDITDRWLSEGGHLVLAATQHFMSNVLMEFNGGEASVETYALAHHRGFPTAVSNEAIFGAAGLTRLGLVGSAENEPVIGFRYLDRFTCRGGEWRIFERRLVFEWSRAGPYSGLQSGGLYDATAWRGGRQPHDPLYDSQAAQ